MIKRRTLITLLSALATGPVLRRWTHLLEQRGLVVRNGWILKETDL